MSLEQRLELAASLGEGRVTDLRPSDAAKVLALLSAARAFRDFYRQAGIGPCREGEDDADDGTIFSPDERFNVRQADGAIKAFEE